MSTFCVPGVLSASKNIITSTQPSTFNLQTSETLSRGAKITPTANIFVTGVTRSTLTTATRCRILDSGGSVLATSTTLVGGVFTFSGFALSNGTTYRIEMDASGGSYNFEYCGTNTAATSADISWVTGSRIGSDNGNPGNVKSVQYYT